MGELIERTADQVQDLSREALRFRPEGVHFSIARLVLHMTGSEYGQMRNLLPVTGPPGEGAHSIEKTEPQLEPDILSRLDHGVIDSTAAMPEKLFDAGLLVQTMRDVHQGFTIPVCRRVPDPEVRLAEACRFETPRDLIAHMNWHWTYHSGQVGLLRLQWGDDYVWTLAERSR
jgi:uncharacterized damage-inducible protein DinB